MSTPNRIAASVLMAGLLAIASTSAMAGECPADKIGANPLANAPSDRKAGVCGGHA